MYLNVVHVSVIVYPCFRGNIGDCAGDRARTATERARRDETGGASISRAQRAGSYLFSRSFARAHVSRGVGGVERVGAWVD